MLQSTYRSVPQPTLPPPWTQHKAPSGHTYYYNPETKQSTYTHPAALTAQAPQFGVQVPFSEPLRYSPKDISAFAPPATAHAVYDHGVSRGHFRHGQQNRFRQPQDRPKSKLLIPGSSPWILVKTRLRRRFVHNPTTNESYWKFPEHLAKGISELESGTSKELPASEQAQDDPSAPDENTKPLQRAAENPDLSRDNDIKLDRDEENDDSDEYEEVEVTDEELEDGDDYNEDHAAKRQRLSQEPQEHSVPAEFGEEEMAYQLADLEGGDDYDGDWQEGDEDETIDTEEAESFFKDLLDDYKINPFTTWDVVVSDGAIIDDDRYTLLPNMKARKEVFAAWSTAKIQALKQEKDRQNKQNPLIPYLAFLDKYATPKLFWAEFKRKYKREPELKDGKLSDKEREKLYREHINRLTKISEDTRIKELRALLQSIPPSSSWNRSTTLDQLLPFALITDLRYISLPTATRNSIISEFLTTLPAQEQLDQETEGSANAKSDADREKLERALKRREKEVQDAKRQQEKQLLYGKRRLQDENEQLERATKVDKAGLGRALEQDNDHEAG